MLGKAVVDPTVGRIDGVEVTITPEVGDGVGPKLGADEEILEGFPVGILVGKDVGAAVGAIVGLEYGCTDGCPDGVT